MTEEGLRYQRDNLFLPLGSDTVEHQWPSRVHSIGLVGMWRAVCDLLLLRLLLLLWLPLPVPFTTLLGLGTWTTTRP